MKPRKKPGSPRADDRRIFNGLIYLARTGSQWQALPAEYGPKSTAYDRYREWLEYGCLEKIWATLLQQYGQVIGIDWEWQAADGCIVKAPLGKVGVEGETEATGRNPTDRGKLGCKRHLLTEGRGVVVSQAIREVKCPKGDSEVPVGNLLGSMGQPRPFVCRAR